MLPPPYWEPRIRHRFPPEYNALVYWRILVALAMVAIPGTGFLLIQAEVTREAAAGRALTIAEPRPWPVAAIVAGLVISVPAAAVLHFLVNDTRQAARAVLLHDAFQCVLLAIAVLGCWLNSPVSGMVARGLVLAAIGTGIFAAEGVWVAVRTLRVRAAVAISVGYLSTVALGAHIL